MNNVVIARNALQMSLFIFNGDLQSHYWLNTVSILNCVSNSICTKNDGKIQ